MSKKVTKLTKTRRRKALYLCGPMTGVPEHNFPAFEAGARRLRKLGFSVINPAELDEEGVMLMKLKGNYITSGDHNWVKFLVRDLKLVVDVDAVVVLPRWEQSRGARLEIQTAVALKKPVYRYRGLNLIPNEELHKVEFKTNIVREAENLMRHLDGNFRAYSQKNFGKTAQLVSEILGHAVSPNQVLLMLLAVCLTAGESGNDLDEVALETYVHALRRRDLGNGKGNGAPTLASLKSLVPAS